MSSEVECHTAQIAYGCVKTSGLPDHARPRRVMVKDLTRSIDLAKSYIRTGLEHGEHADAEAGSWRSWSR